jgi:hypothetical protein
MSQPNISKSADAWIAWQDRQMIKHIRANQRVENAKARTPREQLRILDARLGVDVGAKKERAKLLKAIQEEFEPVGEFSDPGPSHNTEERHSSEFWEDTYESDERLVSQNFIG